ncbi:MAG: Mth938-like domain-containing protein [Pseudomonadota bacterium]
MVHDGPVLVLRDRTLPWSVGAIAALTADSLAPVIAAGGISVLLIGCGARMALVPASVREPLRAAGIVIEPMDTGGACRTYNVLLGRGPPGRRGADPDRVTATFRR